MWRRRPAGAGVRRAARRCCAAICPERPPRLECAAMEAVPDSSSPENAAPFDGREAAARLSLAPGVYRMVDGEGTVIYVGKARSLRKRVSSYFQASKQHSPKVRAMVSHVRHIEVTVTRTETEALLLESNLIKSLRPRYNIVLRDDKTYPYIRLAAGDWPRLAFHRGLRQGGERYFGPFASAGAVRSSLNLH